jgi:CBS domain containing-hemolysin-like protein
MFDRDSDRGGHLVSARTDDPPPASPALARQTPRRPAPVHRSRVAPADPASRVMTDFSVQTPVSVTAERPIDDALRDMMVAGVRALLVTRGESVIGLITSYDIQGERPMQFLHEAGFTRHDEIQVGHIMTPWERVPTLEWDVVRAASVQDIAEQFRTRRSTTHIVVLERTESGAVSVRGLFSRTQLERQLEA